MGVTYRLDEKRKNRYLGALRQGMRRGEACKAAGVCRSSICDLIKRDPEFAAACEQAEVDACDPVESVLHQKALSGNMKAIEMWLTRRSAARWADRKATPTTPEATPPLSDLEQQLLDKLAKLECDNNRADQETAGE